MKAILEDTAKIGAATARAIAYNSQRADLQVNADGSVDVWFATEAPAGKASNWVQTIPGKGWFMILRLCGPLEPWFNQSWRPGEITLVL